MAAEALLTSMMASMSILRMSASGSRCLSGGRYCRSTGSPEGECGNRWVARLDRAFVNPICAQQLPGEDFRRSPDLVISSPSTWLALRLHPSHSRSISSSEKSSGPARGSSKKGRMSTSGPSNHSWCPGWVSEETGGGESRGAPESSLLLHCPPPSHTHHHHHSRCSKQQFRSVPTTPPLRTVESGYWVRGSSRWTTHLRRGTTQFCPCSLPPPPRGHPGLHLSRSSRKARAAGRWLRLESTGPR